MMPSPANNSPTILTPISSNNNNNGGQQQQQQPSQQNTASSPLYPLGGGHHQLANIKFLNKQDRESLLQYTKHFVRKAVQIVVQSRLGEKKPTKSRVYAYNTDWFNLSIKDLAQITAMTKGSLGAAEALFGGVGQSAPLCVEISLRTPENQTMILETWCILFNDQLVDPTQKVCYNVYKKMSLVLRSLTCLTRSIPTYQLSRRQNADTYVLLYRMYTGEPVVHHLGENYATAKVGTVGTPVGSLIVNVAYRTRLTMTPQNSYATTEYTPGILIKDDHFTTIGEDLSSNTISNKERRQSEFSSSSSNRGLGSGGGGYSPVTYLDSPPPHNTSNDKSSPNKQDYPSLGNFNSSNSSLSKRSSSNLNTIVEVTSPTSSNIYNLNPRQSSKSQPIPMKSSVSQQQITSNQSQANNNNTDNNNINKPSSSSQAIKRFSSEVGHQQQQHSHEDQANSADEFNNSSSMASTPDTVYYFKLKSAAFVPSTSFTTTNTNNYSASFGNLHQPTGESSHTGGSVADLPPFITLLSNEFAHLTPFNNNSNQNQNQMIVAQSPPPPNNIITEPGLINRHTQSVAVAEQMASPCSLPNFKLLDNLMGHNSNTLVSNAAAIPDDFVFIEPRKIAFGLSNAADDLRTFFRACENAPMCESFQQEPPLNDILKDLDQQLLTYESKVGEFDDLIKSLESN